MEIVDATAYNSQRPGKAKPVATSTCVKCLAPIGASEVLRSEVKQPYHSLDGHVGSVDRRIPIAETYRVSDLLAEAHFLKPNIHIWPPAGESNNSLVGRQHRLRLCQAVLLTQ